MEVEAQRRGLAKLYTQENDFRLAEVYGAYEPFRHNRCKLSDIRISNQFFDYFLELEISLITQSTTSMRSKFQIYKLLGKPSSNAF